ncbi:MAG TPA: NifB/NifX family molybdenum-iron cluster-binding protein [Spirochaetia bacterium]|nr:NifB/NifX family molybdenum-iron cluster-binding protein [Spirochaetia bacterium]
MRIAFTTEGDNPKALHGKSFGRAPQFMIFDSEKAEFELVDNTANLNAAIRQILIL